MMWQWGVIDHAICGQDGRCASRAFANHVDTYKNMVILCQKCGYFMENVNFESKMDIFRIFSTKMDIFRIFSKKLDISEFFCLLEK